ncbi:MAG: hypothetical protein EAZ37_12330 [Burkholderiales bacterium]|nr:MAG: hypothetical protein EAZ37_12330 [Burkholderiales bacterium]
MKKKTNKKIEILKLTIKLEHVKSLNPIQRHVYYLLGHMANEFQTIQLMLIAVQPSTNDERLFRIHAEMSQVWFFIRTAIGKIYEASDAIKKLSTDRSSLLFANHADSGELEKLLAQTKDTQWLGKIRNKLSFHYPNNTAWQASEEPEQATWSDDEIYMTKDSARTFYQGSDHLLLSAVLQKIDERPNAETVNEILQKTTTWVKEFCELLNRAMAHFIEENFPDLIQTIPTETGTVLAPHISNIRLPFWYYNEMDRPKDS